MRDSEPARLREHLLGGVQRGPGDQLPAQDGQIVLNTWSSFSKTQGYIYVLQVHKPVQELLHRKKCLLADDPELAAAPADGNDGDDDDHDDDDHDDDSHDDDGDGNGGNGDVDEDGISNSVKLSLGKSLS